MADMTIRTNDPTEVVRQLSKWLCRSETDQRPVVLMTCGIAGAGKTTFAKEVLKTHPNFQRLSIDEIIASQHGLYNVDYDPSKHEEYSDEAVETCSQTFHQLLSECKADIVLDRAFYDKADRDEFKALVEKHGARWVLVYFKVESGTLWRRINSRKQKGVTANSALEISEDLFKMYVEGFDHPNREGEIVVEYTE